MKKLFLSSCLAFFAMGGPGFSQCAAGWVATSVTCQPASGAVISPTAPTCPTPPIIPVCASSGGGSGPVAAIPANTFLNSMGVNTHLQQGYAEAPYEAEFTFTGIRNARDSYSSNEVTLHNNTKSGSYPGVKFDVLESPSSVIADETPLDAAGGFLAAEGPNEPNNQPITYLGNPGGGSGTWVPVAQWQRDLYSTVKGSSLSSKIVFGVSEDGAETDNVGLQCLVLNSTCPGSSAVTLMAANTVFSDYVNSHNYVQGNGGCGTPAANQAWNSMNSELNSCWDGYQGNGVSTWNHHYLGYKGLAPRVTTETGWNSDSPSLDYQGKVLVNTYLDGYKEGNAYTFVYEMVDQQGSSSNQGFYTTGNVAKLSATYVHNLTTVLADTTNFTPSGVAYAIAAEPSTVHDMLLQKSNGKFELIIWDEQTTTATTDNITVTFPAAHNVTEYDVTVGTSSVNTFSAATSIPLTLSDHAVILEFN